jgi:hypothetical protein
MMAESMKKEMEGRILQKNAGYIDIPIERLGIYNIHIQHDGMSDEESIKTKSHAMLLWVRYSFGDKNRKLHND